MKKCTMRFLRDETGAVPVEYALILTLISIVAIGSMLAIGGSVNTYLTDAHTGLSR
jgi:Flp pilus assembly pilin Flp